MVWYCHDLWGGVPDIKKLKYEWLIVLLILGLGAYLRYLYLLTPGLDSDQAVVGLMAKHILQGELPIFYYGQPYLGSLEAFWVALNFKLFGMSTFVLDMSIAELSMVYFLVIYGFARSIFGNWVGLATLLYVVVAPFYLEYHYVLARGAYIELLILGTLFLWLLYDLFYRDGWKRKPLLYGLAIGFLGGIMWWLHPMSVYYILTGIILLLLYSKKFLLTRYMLVAVIMFFVGSFPFWWWHYERHFHMLGFLLHEGSPHYWRSFLNMWGFQIPILLGLYKWPTTASQIPFLSKVLFVFFIIAVVWMLESFKAGWQQSNDEVNGKRLVALFITVVTLVYVSSGWGEDRFPRHLIPVFSVVPVIIAYFSWKLSRVSGVLSVSILLLFVFSSFHSAYPDIFPLTKRIKCYEAKVRAENGLFRFLLNKGIRGAYAPNYWLGLKLTFRANEKVVFATQWGRYPKYVKMVDSMPNSAYVFRGGYWYENFRKLLSSVGVPPSKRAYVDGYTVYYDFSAYNCNFVAVDRSMWRGMASGKYVPYMAFDGNIYSRWKEVFPVKRGSYFVLDMGREEDIGMIRFVLPVDFRSDIPRIMRLYTSVDALQWRKVNRRLVGFYSMMGRHLYYKPYGMADVVFPSRKARYIKFVYISGDKRFDWSIPEVFVYKRVGSVGDGEKLVAERRRVISYLKRHGVKVFFGDFFTASFGALHTHILSLCYGNNILYSGKKHAFYVEYESYRWRRLDTKVGFLVRSGDAGVMDSLLNSWGIKYSKNVFGWYTLFTTSAFKLKRERELRSIKYLGVKVINGDRYLVWFSKKIRAKIISIKGSRGALPQISGIEGSEDGKRWEKVAFLPSKLYWINGFMFTAFRDGKSGSYVVLSPKMYKFWRIGLYRKLPAGAIVVVKGE